MQFTWTPGNEDGVSIEAENEEQAYRIVLANRLQADGYDFPNAAPQEAVAEAAYQFRHRDLLIEITSELTAGTASTFTGTLPTDDEIEAVEQD